MPEEYDKKVEGQQIPQAMPEIKTEELIRRASQIPGARRAAIFLVSLEQEVATKLMLLLSKEEIERISIEIAKLDMEPVTKEERDAVMEEFYHLHLAQQYVESGGVEYARRLLERVLPPEEVRRIIDTVVQSLKTTPFSFLRKVDFRHLMTFIQDEHPQTIAVILAYLPPQNAAEILESLSLKKQQEVLKRLSSMEDISPEIISQVEKTLEAKLTAFTLAEIQKPGGVKVTAEILNYAQRSTEKNILAALEEDDPELVESIKRLMFTFEDILRVNDRGIQTLLRHLESQQLALALKTATPELKEKFFKNMSKRAQEMIKEELEFMGPVRLSDVEAAQQTIVDIARKLEEQGELIIEGRGAEIII
jgi:flagellar motor switch protein FliG